uniref:AAA ATPase domain-containing protein n=1 Tax=Candidatus Kentrum sp. TUN TaxID=2126343 RepID=A0A451A114_9GAMM|nr:MAG: AAA ATPase domain-containing protein [Candidatus Kentron sp. TUN]VFK60272.1 MAG: AAA ATPase domain-containing protein [Candidatus Kentron sp. TUN]VFK69723.1 MAG: AAA ATPase domain-containing protein [Candidatus Kentron sp. TUN]
MSTIGNFHARLGNQGNPSLLPQYERLTKIEPGRNPFVSGTPLPGNSPAFFGRSEIIREILATLRHPEKPGCVSLLGERRMGKSSLLNQVFWALGNEEGLITILTDPQGWLERYNTVDFFADLHRAIVEVLPDDPDPSPSPINYSEFGDFIREKVEHYRFVLILDEFETIANNPKFGENFFANLRHLGSTPEFAFGYLLASRRPLSELKEQCPAFESSSFWNIFGLAHMVGLLQPEEAMELITELWQRSLGAPLAEEKIANIERKVGLHPAFIQMIMEKKWHANQRKHSLDWDETKPRLRKYFEQLWEHRTPEELKILLKIAKNKDNILTEEELPENATLSDLRTRGLITPDNRFFSEFFGEFIPDSVLTEAKPHKKAIHGILNIAKVVGKVRNVLKPQK